MTTTPLLHSKNKNLEEIKHIVKFIEAIKLAKYVIGQIVDLTIIIKKKQLSDRQLHTKFNEKCFHYGKKEHYVRDCYLGPK